MEDITIKIVCIGDSPTQGAYGVAGYEVLAGYIRKGLAELFPQMAEIK